MMSRTVQPEAAQANDHLPAHLEGNDAQSRFTAEAHESYNTTKFEPASANPNPGNNHEISAMLQDFAITENLAHPYQIESAPMLHPPGEINPITNPGEYALNHQSEMPGQPVQPFESQAQMPWEPIQPFDGQPQLPGQPGQPYDGQAQMPGAISPLDQQLFGIAQNSDATPAQQAALGIEQSIASSLMGMLTGGFSGNNGSDSSDGSDGSDGSYPSDNSNYSDNSQQDNSQQDDSASYSTPAWMQQYALSN